MADLYKDPENTEKIIQRIKVCPTMNEIHALVLEVFPKWIVGFMPKFSSDYQFLNESWEKVCCEIKVPQTQIMIVDALHPETSTHNLVKNFAECFTRSGFCVRSKAEYVSCSVCGSAIPAKLMWNILKESHIENIPSTWSNTCTICSK